MATLTGYGRPEEKRQVLEISRKEAVELIAFLTGHLAGVAVPGNQSGASPSLVVWEDFEGGKLVGRIAVLLEPDRKG